MSYNYTNYNYKPPSQHPDEPLFNLTPDQIKQKQLNDAREAALKGFDVKQMGPKGGIEAEKKPNEEGSKGEAEGEGTAQPGETGSDFPFSYGGS